MGFADIFALLILVRSCRIKACVRSEDSNSVAVFVRSLDFLGEVCYNVR